MNWSKKSIDLYEKLLVESADGGEKELFRYLVGQEKEHFTMLDELVTMLRHAEEWVESPEFGLRKEEY